MRTLRLLLDNPRDSHRFFLMAGNGTRGRNPRCSSWTFDGSVHTRRAFAAWLSKNHGPPDERCSEAGKFSVPVCVAHLSCTSGSHRVGPSMVPPLASCCCLVKLHSGPTTTKKSRRGILSKKHWWLVFFISKSGWPKNVPNTHVHSCRCVGNSDPPCTTAVGSYVSAVHCSTPHPDGFTPASFHFVFPGLRMLVVLNIASCSAAWIVVVLSGHGINTCLSSKKAN